MKQKVFESEYLCPICKQFKPESEYNIGQMACRECLKEKKGTKLTPQDALN